MADAGIGEAAAAESVKGAGEATAATAAAADTAGTAAATSAAGATAAGSGAAAAGAGAAGATGAGLTIGQQLAVGAGSALASGVIQKVMTPSLPGAPKAAAVQDMPTADSDAVAAAKKKSIIEQMASRGRASTILTDTAGSDKLGG